jgi:hypothetical protein
MFDGFYGFSMEYVIQNARDLVVITPIVLLPLHLVIIMKVRNSVYSRFNIEMIQPKN